MTEITQDQIRSLVDEAEIQQLQGLEHFEGYWQAELGDPVNATIQVEAENEEEARAALTNAAWEMVQTRKETEIAAATPHDPPADYSEEQLTGFSKKALASDDPTTYQD